jgi:hypothetical protein
MMSKTAFHALQHKPVSSFSDHDVDVAIDLHLQRNALGLYGSLTGRGAPETRETLGRAFAIAKSKLSEYGYLAADGSATRKGIRKAVEKLHDEEAWDKYVDYETVLKTFRKGDRRAAKPRSELQRKIARQQLARFRSQEFEEGPQVTPEAMAKQILAQMGVVPKPARAKTQKKAPARQQKPARSQVVTPQSLAAMIKARMAR